MRTSAPLNRKGFTLIELLLVIGIIAILAAIVIVAINPTRRLGSARDAQRKSDINTIVNAIYQFSIDNGGRFPGNLSGSVLTPGTSYKICKDGNATTGRCPTYNAFVFMANHLTGSYIVKMPQDPSVPTSSGYTGYTLTKLATGRIQIDAPHAEITTPITVSR